MSNQTYAAPGVAPSAVPSAITTIVPAVGRVLISTIFILSGLSKLAAPAMTIGYIQSVGLPLPQVAFGLAAFIEIVGGITLLLGYRTRIAAGVLFLFAREVRNDAIGEFGTSREFRNDGILPKVTPSLRRGPIAQIFAKCRIVELVDLLIHARMTCDLGE